MTVCKFTLSILHFCSTGHVKHGAFWIDSKLMGTCSMINLYVHRPFCNIFSLVFIPLLSKRNESLEPSSTDNFNFFNN